MLMLDCLILLGIHVIYLLSYKYDMHNKMACG